MPLFRADVPSIRATPTLSVPVAVVEATPLMSKSPVPLAMVMLDGLVPKVLESRTTTPELPLPKPEPWPLIVIAPSEVCE